MEQAVLARRDVEDQDVLQEREHRPSVVPLQGGSRDAALKGVYAPPELDREDLELLAEIATGVTTEVAARHLELSARTLRRRIRNICDVLGVNTSIEAVVWAARRHLI
ncbi:LuxR family transcriptional regulator [Nocardiopsis sp. LOL_012]|uniref:LuxR family transcriptional regulator n=1 Tax=Nocardiopsis sp. LOL_012 TaxID=3345409 RepID=UPI003A8C2C5B